VKKQQYPVNNYQHYHAHLYFDQSTVEQASSIVQKAGDNFDIKVGRLHQKIVGPHPRWSCQLSFSNAEFEQFIPWLDKNRQGLTVFVHSLTGNNLNDHTIYAAWLGEEVELSLSMFMNDAE
jgi:DOPA 4,5-dioxygenase